MERILDGPRQPNARMIGVVHLSYVVISGFGDFVIKRVVVADPVATATNILAHEATYRAGFAMGLLGNLIYIALTALFYRLFKPVDRTVSLMMAFFSLVGCTTQIVAGFLLLAPVVVLRDSHGAGAFQVEQLRAVALASLRLYSQTFNISFVLFAVFDFCLGYLIYRSTFLPRILGVLMMIAGVLAMTFLYPPLAIAIEWYVLPIGGLAEGALMLWLLVKGVNVAHREV